VSYVSVDPVPLKGNRTEVVKTNTDSNDDFYWLNGGVQ